MQLGQTRTRTRCREFTGPTPNSVAVTAKPPAAQMTVDRQKWDAAQQLLQFANQQRRSSVQGAWLQSSEQRFIRRDLQRRVKAAVKQQEAHLEQRRLRLAVLLQEEELQLLQEMEEKEETLEERRVKMKEKVEALRDRREAERKQLVSDRMELLLREQSEELRTEQVRQRQQQVSQDQAAQVRIREELQLQQQQEEKMFDELMEAKRRSEEQQENLRVQRRRQKDQQQLDVLRKQMDEAEQQKQQQKKLKEEETRLLVRTSPKHLNIYSSSMIHFKHLNIYSSSMIFTLLASCFSICLNRFLETEDFKLTSDLVNDELIDTSGTMKTQNFRRSLGGSESPH